MTRTRLLIGTLLGALLSASAFGAEVGSNVALGKTYTLRPSPNYHLCTDPGDKTQLTDGEYTGGYFWTQTGTVGWTRRHPVVITIDLKQVQPIQGISYSTAAGTAGVQWPLSILVLVSDDGKTYRLAGDLVELDARENTGPPLQSKYGTYRFRTTRLATRGQYVTLLIPLTGPYSFVDEIEVHRGPDSLLSRPPSGRIIESIEAIFAETAIIGGVRRRLRQDLAAVGEHLKRLGIDKDHTAESADIARAIGTVEVTDLSTFRTVLPLNDLHRRIFALQAAAWCAGGVADLHVWQKNHWDPLSPTEWPGEAGASVDIAMMRGEYRSASLNISNAGMKPVTLKLSVLGLPDTTDSDLVTVHEVPLTDTKSGFPVAAALPVAERVDGDWRINVAAGMTRQVWLTLHSAGAAAGTHYGRIRLDPAGLEIPINLRIYPLDFPEKATLHVGGWDYTDGLTYDVTEANRDALIAHLRDHFVNTPWAQSGTLARGVYDTSGNLTARPDTIRCDQWLQRWPDAKTYCVFRAFTDRFGPFQRGTPVWRNAVTAWINFWVDHLGEKGVEPGRLALLLVDENHSHEQDERIIDYAKVIRAAQPKVVIWQDPTWRDPNEALPEMFQVCDVLCPNTVHLIDKGRPFADFYRGQQQAGRELWFYSCSNPGKRLDPYAYHRMQHWFCFQHNAKGSCFWAFGDSNGASGWNEYLSRVGAYTPVFLDKTTVTAGKHMEAIREGIEDYQTLRMLRDRVDELSRSGDQSPDLIAARKLLITAAERVTSVIDHPAKIHWQVEKDRTTADQVRIEVLEMLTRLADHD